MTDATGASTSQERAPRVRDLRDALDLLADDLAQLIVSDRAVDPDAELAGVYKRVGAAGTVARPTKRGPAMTFTDVTGYPGSRVLVGLVADRRRVARLLGCEPENLGRTMSDAIDAAIPRWCAAPRRSPPTCRWPPARRRCTSPPTPTSTSAPSCPPPPTRPSTPARTSASASSTAPTPRPATATSPSTASASRAGTSSPSSSPPAVTSTPSAPRPRPPASPCPSPSIWAWTRRSPSAPASRPPPPPSATTSPPTRPSRSCASPPSPPARTPSSTRSSARGRSTRASPASPPRPPSSTPSTTPCPAWSRRSTRTRPAAGSSWRSSRSARPRTSTTAAPATYHELKNVILVNDDVDVFDSDDVLWAMTTRMVGDTDIVTIPGVSGHVLDPTQQPAYDPRVPTKGVTTKTIYDATYPWRMRDVFERAQFLDVDPEPWLDAAQPYAGSGE